MSEQAAKIGPGEMPMIHMNGSIVPLAGHELVATLRNRKAMLMLFPALLFDALRRFPGKARRYLPSVSLPATILATLSAEAFGIILMDSETSPWGLQSKLGLGAVF